MADTYERKLSSKQVKFFFCFEKKTADLCCCLATLRTGTKLICTLYLVSIIVLININSYDRSNTKQFGDYFFYSNIIVSAFQLIGAILILISSFKNTFRVAIVGHFYNTLYILKFYIFYFQYI